MRRHLSYANVAATMALVLSMSGGALAARHYLINSPKQINPKVLRKLKEINPKVLRKLKGKTGATGAAGVPGPQGKEGQPGKEGPQGKEGPAGPYPSGPLPRGVTLRGQYNLRFAPTGVAFHGQSISFGFEFAEAPQLRYVASGAKAPAECAGGTAEQPEAAPGYLCFFSEGEKNVQNPGIYNQASRFGAKVEILSKEAGDAWDAGTWAATSP
jgi:hypothetical protein